MTNFDLISVSLRDRGKAKERKTKVIAETRVDFI
jgi:hypothetical protein